MCIRDSLWVAGAHRAVALTIADRRGDNPDFLAIRVLGNISLNVVRILRDRRFGRRGKHDPLDDRRAADDLFWPHHLRERVLKTLPGGDRIPVSYTHLTLPTILR